MTQKGIMTDFYEQFEKLNEKLDKMIKENKSQSLTIYNLKLTIEKLNKTLEEERQKNEELMLEIERLKNNNNKNSNNSSKPSSANGFKKVMNNREKSNRKKGGQKGHKGKTLTSKEIEKMIANNEIDEVITIEENKNEKTKNNKPIIKYVYDIKIKRIVTKYIIYSDKLTNIISSPVSYGNHIKAITNLLNYKNISFDGIQNFISEITNGQVKLSKGTLYNWNQEISKKLEKKEYKKIKENLLNSLVLHVDESPIKINGEQYYLNNISNGLYTLQYVSKHRSMASIDEFGFLSQYKGILVHDHYTLYYNYGIDHAECNVHVLRYLNAVSEFTNHNWGKELKKLFLDMKKRKEELIIQGKEKIEDKEYEEYAHKYLEILANGKQERLKDLKTNAYKNEELKLLNRLIKYAHNHLLFLKKFFVPFSNNRAENDLRLAKIKQKIGKFRSVEGANIYAVTRSCYSTYKKNNQNIYSSILSLLES